MVRPRVPIAPGLLLILTACVALAGNPVVAQDRLVQTKPLEVTTDTPEYCQYLLRRLNSLVNLAAAPIPHEVADLIAGGRQMCDNGRTRGGIMRLRAAFMLMRKDNGAAYR